MPDTPRSRDCVIQFKGDAMIAKVDAAMAAKGWLGGQGVQWAASDQDDFVVTLSDGFFCGFMLWGSDEDADQYNASTGNQKHYRIGTIGAGGWIIHTIAFQTWTYASRIAHAQNPANPLVAISYHASDRLVFGLTGLWTTEDEWTLSGDPRGSNNYFIGFVAQAPSSLTDGYMTIQVSI